MAIILSKLLTKTDVEKRLSVPTSTLKYLPSFGVGRRAVNFQAMDRNGRLWRFGCSIRKKGHPKPVLSKGWLAFVAHKKLQIGDKVKFYQGIDSVNGRLQYKIEAEKEVKVFGVVFGYAPVSGHKRTSNFYKFM